MGTAEHARFTTAKDQLVTDFRAVIADADELLRATAGEAGEKASAARAKIQTRLNEAKIRLAEVEKNVVTTAREAAKKTDVAVHENPWTAVGVAAGVGFLAGWLAHRK